MDVDDYNTNFFNLIAQVLFQNCVRALLNVCLLYLSPGQVFQLHKNKENNFLNLTILTLL